MTSTQPPIVVALVDDYEVVLIGLAHMFDAYRDLIVIAEIDTNRPLTDDVDIALYDSFAEAEADHDEINVLIDNPHARRVVVYTWNFHPDLIASATAKGASGYLSKTLPARGSSPHCKPCTPARSSSAPTPHTPGRPPASTGQAGPRASPTERPRSSL